MIRFTRHQITDYRLQIIVSLLSTVSDQREVTP